MWVIYLVVNNFAVAILIFTLIVKLATFPLTLKQQKNTAISQLFTPKVKEIQTKYRNNQQKQQEEMAKLQKQGYNPAGGCGTMLVTFLILFGVIDVVYKPMTHMEHIDSASITSVVQEAQKAEIVSAILSNDADAQLVLDFINDPTSIKIVETTAADGTVTNNQNVLPADFVIADASRPIAEITYADITKYANFTDTDFTTLRDGTSRLSNQVKTQITTAMSSYMNGNLYSELKALKVFKANPSLFTADTIGITTETHDKLLKLGDNMMLFGIDLGEVPTMSLNVLVIIPVLSFLLNLLQVFVTQYYQKRSSPELAAQMGGGMKVFMYAMPLLSLWIAFAVPAGVGFYWTVSAGFSVLQTIITNKLWPADKIRAEAKAKMDEKFAETEARATVIKVDADGNEVETKERLSQLSQKDLKEYQRKKLEEARRADAEKYGEEYVEGNDND